MGVLDWMAAELRAAGLVVVEYPGWKQRAAPGAFAPKAVMWHHDASAAGPSPNMPRLIAEMGNGSTPPPLSQVWVDTAGVWHLTGGGRANHAGRGRGWGRVRADQGNTDAIGIETDHTVGEAWPAAQLTSLRRGTRVLLDHMGADASDSLCGHKEYAPDRKIDPVGLDMNAERRTVAGPIFEEDDVSAADVMNYPVPRSGSKLGGLTSLRAVVANIDRVWEMEAAREAAILAAVTAIASDKDITPEQLDQMVDRAVDKHTPTAAAVAEAQRPFLEDVIRAALGEDNASQADAIVDELVSRLANPNPEGN